MSARHTAFAYKSWLGLRVDQVCTCPLNLDHCLHLPPNALCFFAATHFPTPVPTPLCEKVKETGLVSAGPIVMHLDWAGYRTVIVPERSRDRDGETGKQLCPQLPVTLCKSLPLIPAKTLAALTVKDPTKPFLPDEMS